MWEMRRLTGTWRYEVVCVLFRDATLPDALKRGLVVRTGEQRDVAFQLMRRLNKNG